MKPERNTAEQTDRHLDLTRGGMGSSRAAHYVTTLKCIFNFITMLYHF
jgi:hypothetical protein